MSAPASRAGEVEPCPSCGLTAIVPWPSDASNESPVEFEEGRPAWWSSNRRVIIAGVATVVLVAVVAIVAVVIGPENPPDIASDSKTASDIETQEKEKREYANIPGVYRAEARMVASAEWLDKTPRASRTLAMNKRLSGGMSVEWLDNLADELNRLFPSRAHNTWSVIDGMLFDAPDLSKEQFARTMIGVVLRARRTRAENIIGAGAIDRVRDGDDELWVSLYNRTGRKLSAVKGTLEIRDQFKDVIETIEIKFDTVIDGRLKLSQDGRWPLGERTWRIIDNPDKGPNLKFVVRQVIYADGKREVFDTPL